MDGFYPIWMEKLFLTLNLAFLNSININERGCPRFGPAFISVQLSPKSSDVILQQFVGWSAIFGSCCSNFIDFANKYRYSHTCLATKTYANVSTFAARHFKTLAQSFECIFLIFFLFFFLCFTPPTGMLLLLRGSEENRENQL